MLQPLSLFWLRGRWCDGAWKWPKYPSNQMLLTWLRALLPRHVAAVHSHHTRLFLKSARGHRHCDTRQQRRLLDELLLRRNNHGELCTWCTFQNQTSRNLSIEGRRMISPLSMKAAFTRAKTRSERKVWFQQ